MPRVIEKGGSINSPEYYNRVFGRRNFELDFSQPMREGYLVGKFKGGRFLDVGCGLSTCCQLASQRNKEIWGTDFAKEVWGMDFANELIESLRYRFTHINYVIGNATDLPFKKEWFDYIVMGEILEHMEEPEEIIKNVVGLLKIGGILAISVPYDDKGVFSIEEHIWSFTEQELEELLKPYGQVEVKPLTEQRHTYLFGFLTK